MSYRYCILGAGRQGTAAAYDIAKCGDAESILLADADLEVARASARRVNDLTGTNRARVVQLDVTDETQLAGVLKGADVCLSAVPYFYNVAITRTAIEARCAMCDLGGNPDIIYQQLALNEDARRARIAIVPDCGVGPGMMSNLAVYALEMLDVAHEVYVYDGGIPQNPRPPFNYVLFFNVEGLTNEYAGSATYLQDGQPVTVHCFDEREYELIDIPRVGKLEAFTAAGGLATMTQTYAGKLRVLKNKILRYPGHAAVFKGLYDLGFIETEPVEVDGGRVSPRAVLHALLAPRLAPQPGDKDLMIIHIRARGEKNGRRATATVDMLDFYDDATGFSAMERTTGFHLAIVAQMIARGEIARGAIPLERAVNAARLVEELARREIQVTAGLQFEAN